MNISLSNRDSKAAKVCITAEEDYARNRVLEISRDIPFYEQIYYNLQNTTPSALAEVLGHFPVVDKTDLIAADTDAYALKERYIALFSETSGTTKGEVLLTPRGRDELRWNSYNLARAYGRNLRPGRDRIAILHPALMSPFAEASAWALKELGIGYLRIFPIPHICEYPRIARILTDYRVTAIMTTPTLAYKLLFELHRIGHGVPLYLDKLLLTGEYIVTDNLRNFDRLLGRGSGAARAFVYGSSEAATVMYGADDGTYRGYLEDFIFEILPTGEPWEEVLQVDAPEGAVTGSLLITWLRDGVMPLIRYNTKDIFTVWQNTDGEWVFRAEGRKFSNSLSPYLATQLDSAIFSAPVPVVHYDIALTQERACITLITIDGCIDSEQTLLVNWLSQKTSAVLNRSIEVRVNPTNHQFYDFSPLTKTQRIEVE